MSGPNNSGFKMQKKKTDLQMINEEGNVSTSLLDFHDTGVL